MNHIFKFQLSFFSLIKFCAFLGFCYGVVGAPVGIFLQAGSLQSHPESTIEIVLFTLLLSPAVGTFNGALMGLLGFPLYRWLSNKVGIKYTGNIYMNSQGDA